MKIIFLWLNEINVRSVSNNNWFEIWGILRFQYVTWHNRRTIENQCCPSLVRPFLSDRSNQNGKDAGWFTYLDSGTDDGKITRCSRWALNGDGHRCSRSAPYAIDCLLHTCNRLAINIYIQNVGLLKIKMAPLRIAFFSSWQQLNFTTIENTETPKSIEMWGQRYGWRQWLNVYFCTIRGCFVLCRNSSSATKER